MFFKRKVTRQGSDKSPSSSIKSINVDKVRCAALAFFDSPASEAIDVRELSSNHFELCLPFVADCMKQQFCDYIKTQENIDHPFDISFRYNIPIFSSKQTPVANVKNIVAVASGKGGVGKSATSLNLALALKQQGARVGILDADIYGPSLPIMLNKQQARPETKDNKIMQPIIAHGLASNSIGYLVQNDHASIWRGPMASKALSQLLNETQWPLLDYLIVDMPPGTGDIQLTMCQQLPLTAAIVVTTPQDIALNDAAKGIAMFQKLDVPILGIVENMSYFKCGHCQHETAIFSKHGGERLSKQNSVPLIAQLPLDPIIREYADAGKSIIDELPENEVSTEYLRAAFLASMQMASALEESELVANIQNQIEITRIE